MKKSHILTYFITTLLMCISYVCYLEVYLTVPVTMYLHSFHLFGLALVLLPMAFELIFKKELPLWLIIGFYVFVFMAQIGGSAYHLYNKFKALDAIAHAYSGFLVVLFFAHISKSILEKQNIFHQIIYFVAVSILVGVVWEVIEFLGDSWFGMNNQCYKGDAGLLVGQDALRDTMQDLLCDLLGAIIGTTTVLVVYHKLGKKQENKS